MADPPDDEAGQNYTFFVYPSLEKGHDDAFESFQASITKDGNMSLVLPASLYGSITLKIVLQDDGSASGATADDNSESFPRYLKLEIARIPTVLSFDFAYEFLSAIEHASDLEGDQAALYSVNMINISGTKYPLFEVTYTNGKIFREPPKATCDSVGALNLDSCNLLFHLAVASHGTSTLSVKMSTSNKDFVAIPSTKVFVVKVLPQPVIESVSPAFSHLSGGVRVTVHGLHFGSLYSRAYSSTTYGNISVTIGGSQCSHLAFKSDTMVTCVSPRGVRGLTSLHLNISDGFLSRGSRHDFAYVSMMMAGGLAGNGFLGFHCGDAAAQVQLLPLKVNRAVRSLEMHQGMMFVGGSFTHANSKRMGHVLAYDGSSAYPLGEGVDGIVNSMTLYFLPAGAQGSNDTRPQELIVVGGSFFTAMNQRQHDSSFVPGALAAWNTAVGQWEAISDTPFLGRVDVVLSNGSLLFVAGTSSLGPQPASLLSRFDGANWTTPVGATPEHYISQVKFCLF